MFPVQDLLDNPDKVTYDIKDISVPPMSGKFFSFLVWLSFTRFGKLLCVPIIIKGARLIHLNGEYIPEKPLMNVQISCPLPSRKNFALENRKLIQTLLNEDDCEERDASSFKFPTVLDYRKAYQENRCTPVQVADAILKAIRESNAMSPPLRAVVDYNAKVIHRMAQESMDRWENGKPKSFLDGIPVSVKGEFYTKPYPFRCGSMFQPIFADGLPESHLVKNLKEAGAIIIGITNMHEFGTGSLGSNPNRFNLMARNPYNPGCYAGGSSSGSAVSVAAGLCPISLGADGGGSVRIPAALCGLFGLKPTNGLLETAGEMPVAPSLATAGPLCGSVVDTIIAMDVLSKNRSGDTVMPLHGIGDRSLNGLKIGIYQDFFNHCDPSVKSVCKASLQVLTSLGASIVDIKIPELEETRIAHLITIFAEFSNALACDVDKHFNVLNLETLLALVPGFQIQATDYINAQKQRSRAVTFFKHIFNQVDMIVTPSTACLAPKIDKEALSHGKSMPVITGKLVRHVSLANLTGNPAISCPIGLSSEGLPVGLQFIGKWYDENTLLQVAWALEKSSHFPPTKPGIFYDIIGMASSQ